MSLESEFVPYEQALALKELGFDKPCFFSYELDYEYFNRAYYNHINHNSHPKLVSVPLYQQAFRWFREKYDLVCIITFDDDVKGKWFGNLYGHYETHGKYDFGYTELFKTYEEAELECLKKLIEIVKRKK
jgi:hypothetical protein